MSAERTIYLVTFVTPDFLLPDGRPPYPPIAGMYLAGALRKSGFQPRILHLLPEHLEQLVKWMEVERPLAVGFSTLTCSVLASALEASLKAGAMGIPVFWGGVHASMVPALSLEEAADYVVVGEGEKVIGELARAVETGGKPHYIPGVVATPESRSETGPAEPVGDLDDYPPAWDMVDPNQYIDRRYPGGALPFLLTRGCPYRCRFCHNEVMRVGKWRRHSDEYLAQILDELAERASFATVNFHDDYMFESPGKNSSWIDVLAKRGLKWTASFRSKTVTPEFAKWIEENGCVEVRFGMESGHPETLEKLGKNLAPEDHYRAARALAGTSIRAMAGFVINWPGETRESILSSLRTIDDLSRINPRMRFNLGYYIPMPGPPIYEEALEDGLEEPSSTEEWSRIFDHPYRYRGFSPREIEALEVIGGRLYRHYLKPWPMQKLMEPVMRRRWRKGYFKWFAIGAIRRSIKSITGVKATHLEGPTGV